LPNPRSWSNSFRLIVLYEDLKLEVAGLHVPPDKEFDEVSRHYRSMYFHPARLRDAVGDGFRVHKLNMLKEFKNRKAFARSQAAEEVGRGRGVLLEEPRSSSTANGMRTAGISRTTSRGSC